MKKVAFVVWVMTLVVALTATGAFAQTPAASPQIDVNINKTETTPAPAPATEVTINQKETQPAPAPAASVSADVNINRTETIETTAPASAPVRETWGLDGKTVLIGGALLLGIILIAVAAAGRDNSTTVVR